MDDHQCTKDDFGIVSALADLCTPICISNARTLHVSVDQTFSGQ